MKVAVVSSFAMGVNCWLPVRMTGTCATCNRYDTCSYPERVADEVYDDLRAMAKSLRDQSDAIYAQLKRMRKK